MLSTHSSHKTVLLESGLPDDERVDEPVRSNSRRDSLSDDIYDRKVTDGAV
jgi:hypothetical protein